MCICAYVHGPMQVLVVDVVITAVSETQTAENICEVWTVVTCRQRQQDTRTYRWQWAWRQNRDNKTPGPTVDSELGDRTETTRHQDLPLTVSLETGQRQQDIRTYRWQWAWRQDRDNKTSGPTIDSELGDRTETTRHQDLPLTVSLETAGGPSPTVLEGVHTYSPLCDSSTGSNTRVSPVWMRTEDPSLVHTSCAVGSPTDHNKTKFSIVIFKFLFKGWWCRNSAKSKKRYEFSFGSTSSHTCGEGFVSFIP